MTATYEQATDEMLALFKAAWDPRVAVYDNVKGAPPGVTDPWARMQIRHFTGNQATLSGEDGNRRFRRDGTIFVQTFVPIGTGLSTAYSLAKIVADAYEGEATASAVWFRNVRINEIGDDGEWFQTNVLADFTYDEVK